MNKSAGYFALAIAAVLGLGMALTLAPVQTAVTVHSTLTDSQTAMKAGNVVATVIKEGNNMYSIDSGQGAIVGSDSQVTLAGAGYLSFHITGLGIGTHMTAATDQTTAIVFDDSP